MSDATAGNKINVYNRAANGALTFSKSVATGGKGAGGNLSSQGALIFGGKYLLAVNAGSNTITILNPSTLAIVSSVSSGGTLPVSLTFFEGFTYVLNGGSPNNITGFTLDQATGILTPIPGSTQSLSAASVHPAQVSFNRQGNQLIVSEKDTSLFDVYPITSGVAGPPTTYASAGITPYGFAVGPKNLFFVSEAEQGLGVGGGTVSSYALSTTGVPTVITGALALNSTAPCWVAINAAETFAYVSNNGTNSVSQLSISPSGALTLLASFGTGTKSEPADLAISSDGLNLYALDAFSGNVTSFTINADGSLKSLGVTTGALGKSGIAVR